MIHIEMRNLCVMRNQGVILQNFSGTITDSCAIIGESGSGKTTLAKALLGLVPYSGEIIHNGYHFSFIPQDPSTSLHPLKKVGTQFSEMCSIEDQYHYLSKMGFNEPQEILRKYPHQLSGGMKQRVSIALAIAAKPDLLIADEPTSGLDKIVQKQIVELLASLPHPLLLITHDLKIAKKLCPEQLLLHSR